MALKVALWIDDADFIDDHSEDALEYLLKILDQKGIHCTFKIAGEKARVLKKHGRNDLIRGLGMHDICYHTQFHTLHPTVVEYLEPLDFCAGAAEFERREIPGLHDVRDIFGRRIQGYGPPGEAWSPDVCPVMMKYGGDICLDTHFILNVHNQAFEYGGMLNFNTIRRIIRYNYRDETLSQANARFDALAQQDFGYPYPEQNRLFSVFYHPGEFYMAEHMSDLYNFADGKNLCYDEKGVFTGYHLPPVISREKAHHYLDLVGEYLQHMMDAGAEFIVCDQLRNLILHRSRAIQGPDVKQFSRDFAQGTINFVDIDGEYISASEAFVLLGQYLSGRPLSPFLVYGPNHREASRIFPGESVTREEIAKAMHEFDQVQGYPMLKSLYPVGKHLLSPIDLCATAARMIAEDQSACEPVRAVLAAENYVCGSSDWGGRWLFPKKLNVENTYEKTRLQCWTLKPIRY